MRLIEFKEIGVNTDWLKLLNESMTGSVFQQPEWLRLWLGQAVKNQTRRWKPRVVGVADGGNWLGFGAFDVALAEVKFLGMRQIEGHGLCDFGDVVSRPGFEEVVWKEMIDKFRVENPERRIILDYVREESPSLGAIEKAVASIGCKLEKEKQEVAPYIMLPDSLKKYMQSLKKKQRHELRRKLRKAEPFRLELEVLGEGIGEDEVALLVDLVRRSSEEKRKFMTALMETFFKDLIVKMNGLGLGKVVFLKVDDEVLAGAFLYEWKGGWYLYNGGFDPGKSIYAGGIVMMFRMIEEAISRGIKRFDFLRGGERYKYDLGAETQELYKLTISS